MIDKAALKEWEKLYEIASQVAERAPWERYWDSDVFEIIPAEGERFYVVLLGRMGFARAAMVYPGAGGLANYLLLQYGEQNELDPDFTFSLQRCVSLHVGRRREVCKEQRRISRKLGYKFGREDDWIYFSSLRPAYRPASLDLEEVSELSRWLELFDEAETRFQKKAGQLDPEGWNLITCKQDRAGRWRVSVSELERLLEVETAPLDEARISRLKGAPKTGGRIEMDPVVLPATVNDPKYPRPGTATTLLLLDNESGEPLEPDACAPGTTGIEGAREALAEYIEKNGIPASARISNPLIGPPLEPLCYACGIELIEGDPSVEMATLKLEVLTGFLAR